MNRRPQARRAPLLIGGVASALCVSAASAAPIVSWGPWVSGSHEIVTGTAAFAAGTNNLTALSLSSYTNPTANGYYISATGKTPNFYSAAHRFVTTSADPSGVATALNAMQVSNDSGSPPYDHILAATSGTTFNSSTITSVQVRHLHVWTKAEFLGDASTASEVQLDAMSANVLDNSSTVISLTRFVIRLGSNFYISSAFTEGARSISDPTAVTWSAYDPLTSITTIGAPASLVASDFENLTAAGIYVTASLTNNAGQSRILEFQVAATAVPEPALMTAVAALAAAGLRRRRKGVVGTI